MRLWRERLPVGMLLQTTTKPEVLLAISTAGVDPSGDRRTTDGSTWPMPEHPLEPDRAMRMQIKLNILFIANQPQTWVLANG